MPATSENRRVDRLCTSDFCDRIHRRSDRRLDQANRAIIIRSRETGNGPGTGRKNDITLICFDIYAMNPEIGVDDRTHFTHACMVSSRRTRSALANAFASPVEGMSPSEYSLTSEFN